MRRSPARPFSRPEKPTCKALPERRPQPETRGSSMSPASRRRSPPRTKRRSPPFRLAPFPSPCRSCCARSTAFRWIARKPGRRNARRNCSNGSKAKCTGGGLRRRTSASGFRSRCSTSAKRSAERPCASSCASTTKARKGIFRSHLQLTSPKAASRRRRSSFPATSRCRRSTPTEP